MYNNSKDIVWVDFDSLENFMVDVFKGIGVPEEDARICADVLITSDKRGIDSHGIGRLKPMYYDRIKAGIQSPKTDMEIVKDDPTTAVIDGHNGMGQVIAKKSMALAIEGRLKGKGYIITKVKKAEGEKGPRYFLKEKGEQEFIRMNSNSYLGMSLREEIIQEEERVTKEYGVGPGAVRFISGTFQPHRELEKKLAVFHQKEDAMLFSSAYSTVVGILTPLITSDTIVISDELNHNCIINALRLSRPKDKKIYKHLDMNDLEDKIKESTGQAKRLIIITDGIFSMRGDYAPLDIISNLSKKYDREFSENILLVVDDSHGIGAYGKTGRGTEEYTNAKGVDVLVGTLGKAFGVNGGYVTSNQTAITYLRETAPMYIYSNPISPAEASAALKSLEILNSERGKDILTHLHQMTKKFEKGLLDLGYEIIESDHPIVPLMVRDTKKTTELVNYLIENGILGTGLNYPVVPKGDEEIRFQINADHTPSDIEYALAVLKDYKQKN